jgi:hypothetical protein
MNIIAAVVFGYDYFSYFETLKMFFDSRWNARMHDQVLSAYGIKVVVYGIVSFALLIGTIIVTKVMSAKPKTGGGEGKTPLLLVQYTAIS